MKRVTKQTVLAMAVMALFAAAAPLRAQPALPQDVQAQLVGAGAAGDQQLFAAVQRLINSNPALAPAIAAQAARQRDALAASIAVTAAQAQPDQAAAIAGAVSAAVPGSALAVFNAIAGLAPDQAGAVAGAVTQAVPPALEEVIAALQLVQTASGGTSTGIPAGSQQAQGGSPSPNQENPGQTPGAVSNQTPSTS